MKKFYFITIVFFIVTFNTSAQSIDSLYHVLDTATQVQIQTKTQLALANHFFYIDTDSARKYYTQFVELNKNTSQNAEVFNKIGICYAYESRFDSALLYMNQALETFSAENDSLNVAFSLNSIGLVNINTGAYGKGIELLLKSADYKERLNTKYPPEKLSLGSTLLNIGIGFHALGNYDKALEYYNKSKENYVVENSVAGQNNALFQIAGIYVDTQKLEEAKKLYQQLSDDEQFAKSPYIAVKLYNNYGGVLIEMGNYNEAEIIVKKAYDLNLEVGNEFSACTNLNNLTNIYIRLKNAKKAIVHGEKALALSKKNHNINAQHSAVALLAEAFELGKQYRQSVEFHKQENELNDSINKIELNKTIADLEGKYQSKKKQQTIKNLETENQLRNLEIKRKNTVNLLTSIILIVFVAALFFVLLAFRKVRKQKVLLDEQYHKLEALNDSLHKMFAIISHDMRNLISGFKGSGELVSYYLENEETTKLQKMAGHLSENADRLEVLLNNLLNWALTESGIYKPRPNTVAIKPAIDNLIALSKTQAEEKNISIKNKIDPNVKVFADPDNFSFIFRNLLSNAIKFTQNGSIVFDAVSSHGKTIITVTDSGVGISKQLLPTIFGLKKENKTLGTSGEKGTGLGLKLVYDFVALNKGNIKIESEPGKGTKIIVELPNP